MRIALRSSAPTLLCLTLLVAIFAGCSRAAETNAPEAAPPPYRVDATIKDLMLAVLDGNADTVWNSVSSVHTAQGTLETVPKTDEDWTRVRNAAITLAESANMLMIPGRRVARPGEKSETPGVELEPEQMDKLIAGDREGWNRHAVGLHDAAMEVVAAVEARNPDKVFEVGERIEIACEGCHKQYWYPNEEVPDGPVTIEK